MGWAANINQFSVKNEQLFVEYLLDYYEICNTVLVCASGYTRWPDIHLEEKPHARNHSRVVVTASVCVMRVERF
jgi:hypothetical protein